MMLNEDIQKEIDDYWDNLNKGGKKQMGSLREEAQAHEPKQTFNIADLEKVNLDDVKLEDGRGTDNNGAEFTYKFFTLNEKEYRVPMVVLGEIKKILKIKPDAKAIKVLKHGSGLNTRYEVELVD